MNRAKLLALVGLVTASTVGCARTVYVEPGADVHVHRTVVQREVYVAPPPRPVVVRPVVVQRPVVVTRPVVVAPPPRRTHVDVDVRGKGNVRHAEIEYDRRGNTQHVEIDVRR